jgi:iron complex outermembrane recepter protein
MGHAIPMYVLQRTSSAFTQATNLACDIPQLTLWRIAAALSAVLGVGVAKAGDEIPTATPTLEEVTVTATTRVEDVNKVPLNVSALSEALMDDQGIKQMDDIARLIPDVRFIHTTGVVGNNSSNLAIRGVFSDVGAPTTGIYIDDTPVQMRNVGYWNSNAFPQVFDLDRIEVLRGPQGTLFGAGAEGGAIRFITPEPGLRIYTGYARGEISETLNGDPSYEVGAAVGGPIVEDRLGFRLSAWGRHDGGYIDRVSPDTGQTVDANTNYQQSVESRAALTIAPVENLKVTASLLYQNVDSHDRNVYWSTLSDPDADEFRQASRLRQPATDRFYLPALKIQFGLDRMLFTSNLSWFYHSEQATLDLTNYFASLFYGDPLKFLPGDEPSAAYVDNNQRGFTEEARLQSNDQAAFLVWTVGVFYSNLTQTDHNLRTDGQAAYTKVNDSLPAFTQFTEATDRQLAGYGYIEGNVTRALKVIAGLRISDDRLHFDQTATSTGLPLAPISGTQSNRSATPKFGVSYQLDADNYLYATATKGFRPGGVNGNVPANLCNTDLHALGLTTTPATYLPDSLWSYELGAKDSLFGGRIAFDSSVYTIKWNAIQRPVLLPSCGFTYVGNLGSATGYGGDISAHFRLTQQLLAGFSTGYVSLTYDRNVYEGLNAVLVEKGDVIGGPPFSIAAWLVYNFTLAHHRTFFRADYSYHNGYPAFDPRTFGYDPTARLAGCEKSLDLRAGIFVGPWELSLFGRNVTNEEAPLGISHNAPAALPYYMLSQSPPTYGITAILRY